MDEGYSTKDETYGRSNDREQLLPTEVDVGQCFIIRHTKKTTSSPGENTVPPDSHEQAKLINEKYMYEQRYRLLEVHKEYFIVDSLDRKVPGSTAKEKLSPYRINGTGPTFLVVYRRINLDQIFKVTPIDDPESVKPGTTASILGVK